MTTLVALGVGAVLGAGLWLVIRGLIPRPVPLGEALARHRGGQEARGWLHNLEDVAGLGVGVPAEDLRVLSRARSQQAFNKLAGMLLGFSMPILLVFVLSTVGLDVSPIWGVGAALLGGPTGFVFADLRARELARDRRASFRHALAAYLDLVKVLVSGGAHADGALFQAALVGEGWQFDELRGAIDWSRVNSQPPWVGFQRLATSLGVDELSELAASISLADEQGASPADALSRKAESLTVHELAEARSKADAATEQMAVPTVLIAIAFVVFLGYPALRSVVGLT